MSNLTKRQNTERSIKLIAAQRQLYSDAKRLLAFDMLLRAPFAVGVAIIALINNDLAAYAGIVTIAVFIFSKLVVDPRIKELKYQAASIQELFDSASLGIPLGDAEFHEHDLDEVIEEYSRRYLAHHGTEDLEDWYPKVLDAVKPQPLQLIGQRFNSWWDKKLRRQYTLLLVKLALLVAILMNVAGLYLGLELKDYVLIILLPILPVAELALDFWRKNNEAEEQAEKNFKQANKLFEQYNSGSMDNDLLNIMIRSLQDAIYHHRMKAPLVFDRVYYMYRQSQEKTMTETAKALMALIPKGK